MFRVSRRVKNYRTRIALQTLLLLTASALVGCSVRRPIKVPGTSTDTGSGHLFIYAGRGSYFSGYSPLLQQATISVLPGEIVRLQAVYIPPEHTLNPDEGWIPVRYLGRPCTSCRTADGSIARIRYQPRTDCYLPTDYAGGSSELCGNFAAEVFLEGVALGRTALSAEEQEQGHSVKASAQVEVQGHAVRMAFTAPRWADKFVQGDANIISWHCPECGPDDRIILSISNDTKSAGGIIATRQPRDGSTTWNAKTVCRKPIGASRTECFELPPGYYWISAAVQIDDMELMHAPMTSSAPFQIVAPGKTPNDITSTTVTGSLVWQGQDHGDHAWVQTAAKGKRLICVSAGTPVDIPNRRSGSVPVFFTWVDVPLGTMIEADGIWENAHSAVCDADGSDPDAPPRLRVQRVRLAGSGIYGVYGNCQRIGKGEICLHVNYLPVDIEDSVGGHSFAVGARQLNGQYMAPLRPGHYAHNQKPFEVRPGYWTRIDMP